MLKIIYLHLKTTYSMLKQYIFRIFTILSQVIIIIHSGDMDPYNVLYIYIPYSRKLTH